ncbi:hypothetical protein ACFLUL_01025 [Chloroflexota bacterium]
MPAHILDTLTAKSLVLVAINIFQPCKKVVLEENLKNEVDSKLLDDVITKLLEEKRVTFERDFFRITLKGMNSIIPGKGRMLRDLQRMEYLSQLSKKGGGI